MGKIIFFGILNLFCALGTLSDKGIAVENEPTFDNITKFKRKLAVGDELVFLCKVKNLGNYSISWLKDEKVIATGNDSVTPDRIETAYFPDDEWYRLVIPDLRWGDEGNYTCQIKTNPPRQKLFTLTLGDPKFVTTNQTFRVTRGENVVLPCEIKDLGDWVPYWESFYFGDIVPQWRVYKEPSSVYIPRIFRLDPKSYKFVNGYSLEIRNVTDDYSGFWICRFKESRKQVRHSLEVVDNNSLI